MARRHAHDEADRVDLDAAHEVVQEGDRRGVAPVDVVDGDQHRSPRLDVEQGRLERAEQLDQLAVGGGGGLGWRIIERARSLIGASAWICATNCSRTPKVDEVSWRALGARLARARWRGAVAVADGVDKRGLLPRPGAPSSTTVAGGTSQGPLTQHVEVRGRRLSRPTSRERAVVPRRRSIRHREVGAGGRPVAVASGALGGALGSPVGGTTRNVRRGSTVGARLLSWVRHAKPLVVRGPPSARSAFPGIRAYRTHRVLSLRCVTTSSGTAAGPAGPACAPGSLTPTARATSWATRVVVGSRSGGRWWWSCSWWTWTCSSTSSGGTDVG